MASINYKPVNKQELTPGMKTNIIKASLQRSINYFLELRNSVDPTSSDYHDFGKKSLGVYRCKTTALNKRRNTNKNKNTLLKPLN
jgi:hypothetical protein